MNIITALHLACECGSEECTSLLLSYGADPNRQDHLLQTALLAACIAGHTSCIHPVKTALIYSSYTVYIYIYVSVLPSL